VRSKQFKGKTNKKDIFSKSNNIKIPSVPLKRRQPCSQTDIKKIAKDLYDRVNSAFKKICEVLFATAMTKARSKHRSIHAPNLTDELSTAE